RTGLRLLLERNGFEVVAEAADASGALRAALRERPALSLIDARLRGGIAVAGRISSRVPQTEVVVLTDAADEHELLEAVQAGASGYLEKTMAPDTLARALRGVMNGESAFPRAMLGPVLEEFRNRNQRRRLKLPARPAIE